MMELFYKMLALLKITTNITNTSYWVDGGLATFDVEKDGEKYAVTMRKVEKKDA